VRGLKIVGKKDTLEISKEEEVLSREEVLVDIRVISLDMEKIGIVYPNLFNSTEVL